MKFPQADFRPFTRVVALPRPDGAEWTFVIRPLPLGFHRRLRERGLSMPLPPVRIARDSAGRPLRDDSNVAVTTSDQHDPEYRREIETYHQRVAVLAIHEALQADPDVAFEALPPTGAETDPGTTQARDWAGFADELYEEFGRAGFTDGDLVLLCNEIGRLSNLLGDQLRQARSNFSPAGRTDTA